MSRNYTKYTFIQAQDTVDCNNDVVNILSKKDKIVKSDLRIERTF